jgi:hypothetical protein
MKPTIYIMGCPCHIVHNTALKAASVHMLFFETAVFEEVCICHRKKENILTITIMVNKGRIQIQGRLCKRME